MSNSTPTAFTSLVDPVEIAKWNDLKDRTPAHALVENTDLVIVRFDDTVSVLYGRCLHRGAILADGFVDDEDNLICGVHNWDYRIDSGVSACHTNNCPVGIATMKDHLRARLEIEKSAKQLNNFFTTTNDLIKVVARACGYDDISKFNKGDLSTFNIDMHRLTGISYAGTEF